MRMDVRIRPHALAGAVTPPPSKSMAHRLLLAAALADGVSTVQNVALSQDIEATLRCMAALGASWERTDKSTLRVTGIGGKRKPFPELPRFDCGESGSTLRFLIPIALAVAGGGVFTGRGRLMERPQKPYFDLFDEKGISYEQTAGALTVRGALTPGEYRLAGNVSSQFFTGLLFALPLLGGGSTLVSTTRLESRDYVAMTRDALARAGVRVDGEAERFAVPPSVYRSFDAAAEADWSQAGFWYAARFLGNGVEVCGLNENSAQGGGGAERGRVRLPRPAAAAGGDGRAAGRHDALCQRGPAPDEGERPPVDDRCAAACARRFGRGDGGQPDRPRRAVLFRRHGGRRE